MLSLLVIAIVQIYGKRNIVTEPSEITPISAPVEVKKYTPPKVLYTCDGRQHCSQITSYEEAKYFLQYCPTTKMDGDSDGDSCERQFGRY